METADMTIWNFGFLVKIWILEFSDPTSPQKVVFGSYGLYFLVKSPYMGRTNWYLLVQSPYMGGTDLKKKSIFWGRKSVHFLKRVPIIWVVSQFIFCQDPLCMRRKSAQFLKRLLIIRVVSQLNCWKRSLYFWVLDLYFKCLDLYLGCLDLYFGCLDLYFGCLDLYFVWLDLYLKFWTYIWVSGLVF